MPHTLFTFHSYILTKYALEMDFGEDLFIWCAFIGKKIKGKVMNGNQTCGVCHALPTRIEQYTSPKRINGCLAFIMTTYTY